MKKALIYILLATLATFTSCENKMPKNGDLDGLWQLMEISDNGKVENVKDSSIYCSFQLKLFMLGSEKDGPRAYFGYFTRTGNMIRFYNFTYRSNYTDQSNEDVLMTEKDIDVIKPWGFYSTDCTYELKVLTDSYLVLNKDKTTITYRKL